MELTDCLVFWTYDFLRFEQQVTNASALFLNFLINPKLFLFFVKYLWTPQDRKALPLWIPSKIIPSALNFIFVHPEYSQ